MSEPSARAGDPAGPEPSVESSPEPERRTSPVELFWDLVFAFAITQVTALLAHQTSWARLGEAMLVLALIWWSWSAFVWVVNTQAEDSRLLRVSLLAAAVLIFLTGLAAPRAFAGQAVLFTVPYVMVRLIHLGLYAEASRQGAAAWSAITGFAITMLVGMVLLLVGAVFLDGVARAAVWLAAALIDYAGPAWITRDRLRGLQHVAVEHFAERYGSFVILCLGESVLAVGGGLASGEHLVTADVVVAGSLGLLIAIGLWWTYFDRFADLARQRLRRHSDPVITAADAYSYIHLIIVAGIIIFAAGIRIVIRVPVSDPLPEAGRLALCGGVAVYLLGLAAFRLRITGEDGLARPAAAAAAALILLYFVGGDLAAWIIGGGIAVIVGVLSLAESTGAVS